MKVYVEIYQSLESFETGEEPYRYYFMDYDDPQERQVLGRQTRAALFDGQVVLTYSDPQPIH